MTLGSIPVVDSYFLLEEPMLASGHLEKTMERREKGYLVFSMGLYNSSYEYRGLGMAQWLSCQWREIPKTFFNIHNADEKEWKKFVDMSALFPEELNI